MIDNIIDFIQHSTATFFSVIVVRLIENQCERCKAEGEIIVEERPAADEESDSETTIWDPKDEEK
jgi:hypothetical protein